MHNNQYLHIQNISANQLLITQEPAVVANPQINEQREVASASPFTKFGSLYPAFVRARVIIIH